MKHQIYSVRDDKADYFLPVFTAQSETQALRQFKEIVVQSDTPISKYPSDFSLYRLGEIDINSGIITQLSPELITNGLAALQAAHSEREKYRRALDNSQLDIEDVISAAQS